MNTSKSVSRFPILIAEDNAVSCKLLEKFLNNAGYEVVATSNGNEALKRFREQFFPIVLTDWMMPGLNGLELCRAIRANPNLGYVFIILLTAKDSRDDIITGLEAGADDYLVKPLDYPELVARLKTAIRILELEESLKAANEEIRLLSITDPLTGCFNRGFLNAQLPIEIFETRERCEPISAVLCDIDHFKTINDTYGHLAGDAVLKEFAACLQRNLQDGSNWVVRYGGEEFLIIAGRSDRRRARDLAERCRREIAGLKIRYRDKLIGVTASFGVGTISDSDPEFGSNPERLIKAADECLYRAKMEGRNRVCVSMQDRIPALTCDA